VIVFGVSDTESDRGIRDAVRLVEWNTGCLISMVMVKERKESIL
jgi:hypothetical protein